MIWQIFLIALVGSPSVTRAQEQSVDARSYCVKYFGHVTAEVEVADAVPERSYDGEHICARAWNFDRTLGAILELCPPYNLPGSVDDDVQAISVSLTLGDDSVDKPFDLLDFSNMLITNGSVEGPFENNGQPAVIVEDTEESEEHSGAWFINGTEAAFVRYPTEDDIAGAMHFDCQELEDKYLYCGNAQDLREGGCWVEQSFHFNMGSRLNFSIWFDSDEAEVNIWSESEYYTTRNNRSGSYSHAEVKFSGSRRLPTVTNTEFWNNSPIAYEVASANLQPDMSFLRDGAGFPLFWNETTSEWYSTENGTYSVGINAGRQEVGFEARLWWAVLVSMAVVI